TKAAVATDAAGAALAAIAGDAVADDPAAAVQAAAGANIPNHGPRREGRERLHDHLLAAEDHNRVLADRDGSAGVGLSVDSQGGEYHDAQRKGGDPPVEQRFRTINHYEYLSRSLAEKRTARTGCSVRTSDLPPRTWHHGRTRPHKRSHNYAPEMGKVGHSYKLQARPGARQAESRPERTSRCATARRACPAARPIICYPGAATLRQFLRIALPAVRPENNVA